MGILSRKKLGIKSTIKSVTLLLCTLGISTSIFAANNVITVKAGTFTIDDTVQSIDGFFGGTATATFEEDDSTFGVEYDRMMNNHVSIGGGFQTYSLNYTASGGASGIGEMEASFITFNSKYHFTEGSFKPFIGGAAGIAFTDFTGPVTGNTVGLALAIMAGFRWQFSTVGLYAEYKTFVSADTEDSGDAEVDVAGDSVTAGLSFAF